MNEPLALLTGGFDAHGAYGPTIVLQLASLEGVAWLRQLFLDVAAGRLTPELGALPQVRLVDLDGLRLTARTTAAERELVMAVEGTRFVWACSPDRWRTNAALMDPFVDGRPGHQYLTSEGVDDALVELSFGEAHRGL